MNKSFDFKYTMTRLSLAIDVPKSKMVCYKMQNQFSCNYNLFARLTL
jgi:hypothetical protein